MDKDKMIRDNWIPTPPTAEGVWRDEMRDHNHFQKIVSLAAQLGGVPASAGCLTLGAEEARQTAEREYYRTQIIDFQLILKNNK